MCARSSRSSCARWNRLPSAVVSDKQDVQLRRRIRKHGCAPVADPHHQRRFAVMHRHHRIGGEDQLGPRPRKADEGEAGQDGREREPAYDLGRRDHMAVQCRRIHLAIADRRQRLDAEEEGVREAIRPSIRHRTGNQPKECGEDDIHQQIKCEQGREELRPGQGDGEMVGIAQIEARNALLPELVGAEANPRHFFVGLALHWNAAIDPSRAVAAPFRSRLQAAPFQCVG